MAVNFKHHHLHVGYRMKDWHYVWYHPIRNPDDDAPDPLIGLHMSPKGDEDLERSPSEGEVMWFPPFDVKYFESKSNPERKRLQKIFLYDAWRYLDEKNEAELVVLEDELKQEGYRKWEAWFDHAKEWKDAQTKRRRAARRARERRKAAGGNVLSVEDDDYSSLSDDSAYDSLAQSEGAITNGFGETAPDGLRVRQPMGNKRRSMADMNGEPANDTSNNSSRAPKNPRAGPSNFPRGQRSAGGASAADIPMSGGLGPATPELEGNDVFRKPQYPRSEAPRKNGPAQDKTSHVPEDENFYDDDEVAIEANGGYDDEDDAMNEAIRRSSVPPEG